MISRKAEASKAVSDLEQQLAEKRRWESSRDDAAKTKRDCEKREKDIKADAPQRKAALDKARRDQEEATTSWTAKKKKARSKTNGAKAAAYAVKQAVAQAARGDKRIADAEKTLQELSATKARFEKEVSEAEDAAADVNAQIAEASKSEDTRMLEKKEVEGAGPCGNQTSDAPRRRCDVVPVTASARWRRGSTPSTRRCPCDHVAPTPSTPSRVSVATLSFPRRRPRVPRAAEEEGGLRREAAAGQGPGAGGR